MSKVEYPRLSRGDIVNILAESQIISISDHNLRHPNHDFVSDLYARILIHLDFLPEEDHGQVEFGALEQFENPDLHLDSVRTMKLFHMTKEVIASLSCPVRFTLKDLIKPDPNRTEFFLSALLNFCLHKETKMALLSPIIDQLNVVEEQRKGLEDKIFQLNAEIEAYNEAREREVPLVQEVDSQVKELRQTVKALNNQQASLRVALRKLKDNDVELDEKISNAEFVLVQSVQENANLRSEIVQSPDKLQRALEEKKFAREEAENTKRSAMQSFQEKTAVVELCMKVFKKMTKHFAQVQAIQEQVNSVKSIDKDLKVLKDKLNDESLSDKTHEANRVEWQGKVDQWNELKRQLEKERDIKCEEATKGFNNVKLEVESRRRDLEVIQKNVEAVVAEADAINSKIMSVKEAGAAKQDVLICKCEEIIKEFHEYANSIRDTLKLHSMYGEPNV